MPVTKQNLTDVFTYHAPTEAQKANYLEIRSAAKVLAEAILENTPQCADQQAALRHVREAVMTANAAVALEGLI
jgi:hypothetical protein